MEKSGWSLRMRERMGRKDSQSFQKTFSRRKRKHGVGLGVRQPRGPFAVGEHVGVANLR